MTRTGWLFVLIFCVHLVAASETVAQELINANNLLTPSLYRELTKNDGNFLVSPFSAEAVLSFLLAGCKGESYEELRVALHLPEDQKKTEMAIKTALSILKGNDKYSLHTVNKIYVEEHFNINEDYKKTAVDTFQSEIENINFSNADKAADVMNGWVEKQTANKIKNLISPTILTDSTALILINALYFKANWSQKFDVHGTSKRDFYKTANDVVKVDTMSQYMKYFNYYESSELKAKFLELSYEGDEEISMVVVLPDEKDGLASLEKQIEKVFSTQQFSGELLNVILPKFKIESKIDFKEILENFGVKTIFNSSKADLSGIADKNEKLVVSNVLQKTFINVNEGGVEAAAATYVAIMRGDSGIDATPKEFVADHPFIFYIKVKNFILFAGRVVDPEKKK